MTMLDLTGRGSPEGVIAAPVGTRYTDRAATNGAPSWVKAAGSGKTGWAPQPSAADTYTKGQVDQLVADSGTSEARAIAAAEVAAAEYLSTQPGVVDAAALAAQEAINAQGAIADPVMASAVTDAASAFRSALRTPSVALDVRSRATPEYWIGDPRWDQGRPTGAAIKQILAHAVKGQGVSAVRIRTSTAAPIVLTETIEFYRCAVTFIGNGVGASADWASNYPSRPTTIRWEGPAGVPMIRIRDSQWCHFEGIHFVGSSTSTPSAMVNMHYGSGDGQGTNARISFARCLFGRHAHGAGTSYQAQHCFLVDGINANNDEFFFENCVFNGGTLSQVRLVNPQSIWGNFVNCAFGGGGTAIGVHTNAAVTLINGQFDHCVTDIKVGGGGRVQSISHHSERAFRVGDLEGFGEYSLRLNGGWIGMDAQVHPEDGLKQLFRAEQLQNGGLMLDGVGFYPRVAGEQGKVWVRGSDQNSNIGTLSVRDCTGLTASQFDVAGGIGTNRRLRVMIQSGDMNINRLVTGVSAEVVPVTPMTP